jgi:hypothetical protein
MLFFNELNIFMFTTTLYKVDPNLILEASQSLPNLDFRLAINTPTNSFFYDPWKIKDEFKNSVWEKLLSTIPDPIGEARIIKLDPGTCYRSHSDIDDRWHLSIIADKSYLVNLDTDKMYPQVVDNTWHYFDAGSRHSAVNFGSKPRFQIVVRKLLSKGANILTPKTVSITLKNIVDDKRYIFDDIISPWLNMYSKKGLIDNFQYKELEARFVVDSLLITELTQISDCYFNLKVIE